MDNHARILIQYSIEVNDQCTHTFFMFYTKRKRRVLGTFLLLLFNAVNLLCSALFRKTKVFSFKMLPKHIIKSTLAYLIIGINNDEIILILVFFIIYGSLLIKVRNWHKTCIIIQSTKKSYIKE